MVALAFACFLTLISFKPLGILQGFGYKGKKLLGWANRKGNLAWSRYSLVAIASALSYAVIAICFSFAGAHWSAIIGLIGYVIFFVLYLYAESRRALRSSVVLTPRFKRLIATLWLVNAVLVYVAVTLLNFAEEVWGANLFATFKYCALAIFPMLVLPVACLANCVTLLWELPKNKSYIKKAKAKIEGSKLTVVAITGSFGKTSAKNVLAQMLKGKYRVLATPSSFNTPLGIARTVNGNALEDYDVFVAEFGARNVGDIAELCELCPPDYSMITGICAQHLESFKTLENIISAKGEIIAGTKNKTVISGSCFEYFKLRDGVERCDCVSEVSADCTGTKLTLTLGGVQKRVKTKLLGAHSADNIGICAQVAFALGVSLDDICKAVEELDFVEHRLQLSVSNGVNIIDDGYNSNVVGAKCAVEVLRSFPGKKVVVTPGLVELGVLEESENKALGASLVGLDYVILVGETLVTAVKQGYLDAGGEEEKLVLVPSLLKAQDALKTVIASGDTVLFLNDLPEIYG